MKLILLIALVCLCGCDDGKPLKSEMSSNVTYTVELLFEYDGIKVYRFLDKGNWIYYTDARGQATWNQREGKHSDVPMSVQYGANTPEATNK